MTADVVAKIEQYGVQIYLGAFEQTMVSKAISEDKHAIFSGKLAKDLFLPDGIYPVAAILFFHYHPRYKGRNLSSGDTQVIQAWGSLLLDGFNWNGMAPSMNLFNYPISNTNPGNRMVLHMSWLNGIEGKFCRHFAQAIEQAYIKNGGYY